MLIVVSLNYLASTFINLESVKTDLHTAISQKVGGEVEYESVDLTIFPLPHAVFRQGTISIPGTASGSMESLSVYPKILPLFTGKLKFSEIRVASPDIKVILPGKTVDKHKKEKSDKHFLDSAKEKVSLLLAPLALDTPDLVVKVKKGSINLLEKSKDVFSFKDIDSRIVFPPAGLEVTLTCSSNIWEKITLETTLDPEDLRGKGHIELLHFRPELLMDYLFPDAAQHRVKSMGSMSVSFETDGFRNVRAEVRGSQLTYVYQDLDKKIDIKGRSLKAVVSMDRDKTNITLTELQLDYPQMKLSGEFSRDRTAQKISLELMGSDMDVNSTRDTVLALAGDIPVTKKIFNIVKFGTIPEMSFSASGAEMKDLGKTENIVVTGNMVDGTIFVPGVDLNLEEVNGEVVISKGILKGERLEARLGTETGRNGTLTIGLQGGDAPFHLDMVVKGNLARIPALLLRLVKNEALVNEIARIDNVTGNAEGRLVLGESLKSVKARVDISEMDLSAHYERLPYPLKIAGGQFSFEATGVSVKNMSVELGTSSFSDLTARLQLGKDYNLQIHSGKGRLVMDEIYPWLSSFENIRSGLKEVKSVKGILGITSLNLEGPLLKPGDWQFEGKGDVTSLDINTTLIPDPVEVTKGKYEINKAMVSLTDTQMNILDASFHVSGIIGRYREGLRNADLTFSGKMGPGATKWLSDVINLPSQLRVRAPLSVSQAHLVFEKDAKKIFKGDFVVRESPEVSIDLLLEPDTFSLNHLSIRDEESHASLAIVLKDRELGFNFDGNVTRTTLDSIFLSTLLQQEWIKGNFKAHILTDKPENSSAQGKLEGKNIIVPWKLKAPLTIESFVLDGSNNQVNVQSADLTLGDNRIDTKGDIKFTPDGFLVDMDISSDGVDWQTISQTFESEQDDEKSDTFWEVPVLGNLTLKSESFSYDRFTWKPLHANISFAKDDITIDVTDASLCSISFPGSVKVTPEKISLDFKPIASRQELEPAFACLIGISRYTTGNFDLTGEIMTEGNRESLVDSLHGNADFSAENGRIYQYGITSKIFAFLNLTEMFRGETPDFVGEGFAYKTIKARADLLGTTLHLKEFVIDSPSMEIVSQGDINIKDKTVDITVLVAPLKTVDFIVSKIPLLNKVTGGNLVSIPIKVTGSLEHPEIYYIPAEAVGSGLLGIMQKTLQAPVKIFVPDSPEKKSNE